MLKKETHWSISYEFFCSNTPTIVCSDAKEKTKKVLENLGLISTGDLVKACLISIKDSFASIVHLIMLSFFNILVTTLTISAKFRINILRKFTLPKND